MSAKQRDKPEALWKIYNHYDEWAREFEFACEKGCATCCTQSVTMTSLEGELILEYIRTDKPELFPLLHNLPVNSPAPATTTNQFAAACFAGKDVDPVTEWNMSPCVFLQDNCCTIYPVRSFMCRSFGSRIRCKESGEARVDPLFLTLNTVIMQCIEHLDQGRPWGNLNTILQSLIDRKTSVRKFDSHSGLLAEPIPRFLIPPDEADKLHKQMRILLGIIKKTALNSDK